MENRINLCGWTILFLMAISGIGGYGVLKNDCKLQRESIKNYEMISLEEQKQDNHYYGYISFPHYQVSRFIEYGNPNIVIERYNIGIFGMIPEQLETESLILVGHNRSNQFAVVQKLKIGDEVFIYKEKKQYYYQVTGYEIISSADVSFLKEITDKTLILITCLDDASKRIVVFCKLQ